MVDLLVKYQISCLLDIIKRKSYLGSYNETKTETKRHDSTNEEEEVNPSWRHSFIMLLHG